jgi:hypothetical protein
MRHLRIVGDGERDAAVLPPLVRRILNADLTDRTTPWPRLHRGQKKIPGYSLKGYGLKLLYVLRSARSDRAEGVVACIDADRDRRRQRWRQMKKAREADRSQNPPLPTALGEAKPHNEAWLLDDAVAVREVLRLPSDTEVPNVQRCSSPKAALEDLHQRSERKDERPLSVWPEIAARVDTSRCTHKKRTGFEAFVREVESELGPLFAEAG